MNKILDLIFEDVKNENETKKTAVTLRISALIFIGYFLCLMAVFCSMGDWMNVGGCLEHLVLTHYDTDHISGVETLLSRIDVETLVVPGLPDSAAGNALLEAAREQGTQVQILREETVWDLGASTLTVYPPLGDGESNEAGLSILCSSGDFDLLITGDMDSNTEEQLLSTYDLPDLEALVVGHHGSKYSTSEALLSTLTPELALISVGDNSYGHPSDQALWRLVQAGAAIYRTDLQGTIHLTVN